ncbi:MAG: LysM peptidoglycan-binding domain-containing protein [Kiritimatiellae bacterium]|nr:LysM peptidoglycan-binding domain-containing protein [Kiritimatiellia bacterium]
MMRGNYGIEFDPEQGVFSFRKIALLLLLIPLALVVVMIYRGCGTEEPSPAQIAGTDNLETARGNTGEAGGNDRTPFLKGISKDLADAATATRKAPPPRELALNPPSRPEPAPPVEPSATTDPQASAIPAELQNQLRLAEQNMTKDDLLGARTILLTLRKNQDAANVREFIERKLEKINQTLLFSDRPMPGKTVHRVVPGDLVGKLARSYNVTEEFLMKVNSIENASGLRIGKELWVLNKPNFCLTVFRKSCSAVLTLNGEFFRRYTVGIGPAQDVPIGTYAVSSRVKKPPYRYPGKKTIPYGAPGNILGTTCLLLSPTRETPVVQGLSLHGTWVNASLGRACSDGRIRFNNKDIEQLALLLPMGARVNIMD